MFSRGVLDVRVPEAGLHAVGIGFDPGRVIGGRSVQLGLRSHRQFRADGVLQVGNGDG
jgi:hypothetical protein